MKTFVNGLFITATSFALIAGVLVCSPTETVKAAEPDLPGSSAVYRLYNPDNGEHLYTTDANERNVLFNDYGWGYEGVAWYSPNAGTPVYRLYNSVLCNHLYTTDKHEIEVLTNSSDWIIDNNGKPLFYSALSTYESVPIYRVYNKELQGMHHLTTDENEYKTLPLYGWKKEGVSLAAIALGNPITTIYSNNGVNKMPEISANNFPYDLYTITKVKAEDGTEVYGYYFIDNYSPIYYEGCDKLYDDVCAELEENYGSGYSYCYKMGTYDDLGVVLCYYKYNE